MSLLSNLEVILGAPPTLERYSPKCGTLSPPSTSSMADSFALSLYDLNITFLTFNYSHTSTEKIITPSTLAPEAEYILIIHSFSETDVYLLQKLTATLKSALD